MRPTLTTATALERARVDVKAGELMGTRSTAETSITPGAKKSSRKSGTRLPPAGSDGVWHSSVVPSERRAAAGDWRLGLETIRASSAPLAN